MTEDNAILNAPAVYTEEEVLARFQQSWRAIEDLIQMSNGQNRGHTV